MINIFAFGCPATKDILDYNPFNNNRNYSLKFHKEYQAIPELNDILGETVPSDTKIVLFDLVADAMFGTVKYKNKISTRNYWLQKWSDEPNYTLTDFEKTASVWKNEFEKFAEYFSNRKITLILNSFRFSHEMVENNENLQVTTNEYPTLEKCNQYNRFLKQAEDYIRINFPDIKIINFDMKNNKTEKNHPVKSYSFYLNEDYYVDTFVQLENLINIDYPREVPKYSFYDLNDKIDWASESSKKNVLIVNYSAEKKDSILRLAWHEKNINDFLTASAVNDYILDGQYGNSYRFIPRISFYRKHIKEFISQSNNKIFYADDLDPLRLKSSQIKKIVFFFMGMPGKKTVNSSNAEYRFRPHLFNNFTRSLTKDTMVIRIADVDGVRGGFYVNSRNYVDYENDMSEFIEEIISKYNIERSNVVLHGTSKGGVGALFYGAKHNLNSVDIDPVIDGTWVINNQQNNHFTNGFRDDIDLVPRINQYLNKGSATHYVLGNHYVPSTWRVLTELSNVKLIDINDPTVENHQMISPNSVPEWLMFINELLFMSAESQ